MKLFSKRIPKLHLSYLQRALGPSVMTFRSLSSTNTVLKEYARQDAPHMTVVAAEEQTSGRGRGEHTFFSPVGSGIYFSLLLRRERGIVRPAELTAAAGVAACRAIEALSPKTFSIKWMNDIYLDGKKVAGILAESGTMPDGRYQKGQYVVLGVGMNLSVPEGGFPDEIKDRADAIFEEKPLRYAREKLIIAFVKEFEKLITKEAHTVYGEYRERLFLLSKRVIYQGRKATVSDLLPDFRLQLTLDDGTVVLLDSGEVSLSENLSF